MPINRKYKLNVLLQTLREELCFKRNYKVLFEYVMLAGVNDRLDKLGYFFHVAWFGYIFLIWMQILIQNTCIILRLHIKFCSMGDARRLVDLVQGIPCKINLISFNPHCGSHFRPTSDEKMIKF